MTGDAAFSVDVTQLYADGTPTVFIFVLGLSFLLMLVAFHSIVIPIKAIILNLLSTAAAYGVLVLVFQHGWFAGPLGITPSGVIESWVPLFIFTILFGLSMDYHLFILTRIKEARDRGLDSRAAVAKGISVTAGTITSAASIMVVVFGVFVTLKFTFIQQLGLGLAVAVFIDATIIRSVLLPASMTLLGDWNWWMPRWLDWIPRVTIEGDPDVAGRRRRGRVGLTSTRSKEATDDDLGDFEAAAPELAATGRAPARADRGAARRSLATVRGAGLPRINPIDVAIVDGHLVAYLIVGSAKLAALEADGRFALHAHVDPAAPSEFLIRGRAHAVTDPALEARCGRVVVVRGGRRVSPVRVRHRAGGPRRTPGRRCLAASLHVLAAARRSSAAALRRRRGAGRGRRRSRSRRSRAAPRPRRAASKSASVPRASSALMWASPVGRVRGELAGQAVGGLRRGPPAPRPA